MHMKPRKRERKGEGVGALNREEGSEGRRERERLTEYINETGLSSEGE